MLGRPCERAGSVDRMVLYTSSLISPQLCNVLSRFVKFLVVSRCFFVKFTKFCSVCKQFGHAT